MLFYGDGGSFVFLILVAPLALIAVAWVLGPLFRLFTGRRGETDAQGRFDPAGSVRCDARDCLAENPRHARFCRRCGEGLRRRGEWD